jgi:YidC/Oxa1 family membrane protein insertase
MTQLADYGFEGVSWLLAFFYELPILGGSYGLAIILLTATVMIVLMPLTIKATRSTIKMTQLQPELRALQKKYKNGDKQELNQAMMALYQEHGVNPVGGCLPMLAQLPVFLVLFRVLQGLTRRVSEAPYFALSERAHELLNVSLGDADNFDPHYLSRDSELFRDLTSSNHMDFGPFGGIDLSAHALDVVRDSLFQSIPYVLLILFVVGSSYFQQRQITARRGAVPDNPTPQQQTQQQLMRILPLMSGVWSFLFPAGLVLYWATSNLFRIGQQAYITRSLYTGDGPGVKAMEAEAKAAATTDAGDDADGVRSDDDLISDGRPGRSGTGKAGSGRSGAKPRSGAGKGTGAKDGTRAKSGSGPGRAGSKSSNGSTPVDREAAWAERRAQRTKAKPRKKPPADGGAGRTTPKGTKPTSPRKKRKR